MLTQLIAHRANLAPRAGLNFVESTLGAILEAEKRPGIDGIEIDIRKSADALIVFHGTVLGFMPRSLQRPEMLSTERLNRSLAAVGQAPVLTLSQLMLEFGGQKPLLLDLKFASIPDDVMSALSLMNERFSCIVGARSVLAVKQLLDVFPTDKILAFPLVKWQIDQFVRAGAGNIRLWPRWADLATVQWWQANGVGVYVTMGNELHPGAATREQVSAVKAKKPSAILVNCPTLVV